MEYKLIAMDLDGTLLTSSKRVLFDTKETLRVCRERGYFIVGVTARILPSVLSVTSIDFFDYLILSNGCLLYDVKNKKMEVFGKLSKHTVSSILQLVGKQNGIDFVTENTYYSYQYHNSGKKPFLKNVAHLDEIHEDILRMNIFFEDYSNIYAYCSLLQQKFPDVYSFVMQDSGQDKKWLVLNPKGIDKGGILQLLGNRLHISLSEVIFFGDGLNDLDVMKVVGCGVAMENSLKEVKDVAQFITLSNDQNGIGIFLKEHLLSSDHE